MNNIFKRSILILFLLTLSFAEAKSPAAFMAINLPAGTNADGLASNEIVQSIAQSVSATPLVAGKFVVMPLDTAIPPNPAPSDRSVFDIIASRDFRCAENDTPQHKAVFTAKTFIRIIPGPNAKAPLQGMRLVPVIPPVCP